MHAVHGDYDRDGYARIEGLIPREVANAFLRVLKNDLDRSGASLSALGRQSPILKREAFELYSHDYPPMQTLLFGLTPTIARIADRDLLPTYCYFRIYREGDICRVHSDRPSCEHSVSLTLDYSDGVPWNLEVGAERLSEPPPPTDDFEGAPFRSLEMQPGDAVLYKGVHHSHGRITPNPNGWSAHLFLHWVDRDGRFAGHAFDGREISAMPVNFSFG